MNKPITKSITTLTALPLCGLALGLALCTGARAFDAVPPAPAPASPAVPAPAPAMPTVPGPSAPYLLAPDDQISIKVVNFSDLSLAQITVAPDGTITVPLLPPLSVTGKTTAETEQMLTAQWREYVVNPSVSVSLVQKRKQQDVLFYGNVAKAGTEEYRPSLHLLAALAEMGGSQPNGDLSTVTVTHIDGRRQTLDLSHPETRGGTEADILLQPGDVVYIPERRDQFSVLGEVTQPGSFSYKDDMTVLDALTSAGGVKETADLSGATLVHSGQERPLNLEALLRRGDLSVNVKLAQGDRILVPEVHNRTYVFGSVSHPGYFTLKPGDRILDALNASSPDPEADLAKINVIRVNKANNTAKMNVVDIKKFLTKGDMTGNLLLQPGDVLYIPDKHRTLSSQNVFGLASGLSVIGSVVRLFTGGF